MTNKIYTGLDIHKMSISVAVAEDERGGEVRFIGDFPNTPESALKSPRKTPSFKIIWKPCGLAHRGVTH